MALSAIAEMGTAPPIVPGYDMLCASDSIYSPPYILIYTWIIALAQIRSISQVKFISIAHFMNKTIQSALHKIKVLQQGVEEALKIHERIEREIIKIELK